MQLCLELRFLMSFYKKQFTKAGCLGITGDGKFSMYFSPFSCSGRAGH